MAQSSEYYQQQLDAMGEMPDFRSTIAEAYEKPIIKPIVGEGQRIHEQYLPTIFDTFASMGTSAGDLSPAAKLQTIGRSLGRLSGMSKANADIQNFYNTQIQDLANIEYAKWQDRQQRLKDLYSMAFQREEAARAAAARQAQIDQMNAINDLLNNPPGGGGGEGNVTAEVQFENVNQLNAYRKQKGLPPVDEEYFKSYNLAADPSLYPKGSSRNPGAIVGAYQKASEEYAKPGFVNKYVYAPTAQGLGMLGEAFTKYNPLLPSFWGINFNKPFNWKTGWG